MTLAIARQRIRLQCDITKHEAMQCRIQGRAPLIWRGADCYVEMCIYNDEVFVDDLTNIVSVTLEVHPASPRVGPAYFTKTVLKAAMDVGVTEAEWHSDAADQQHARFTLTHDDTNLDLTGANSERLSFWLVIHATLTTGEYITLGVTSLEVEEDATQLGVPVLGSVNPTFRVTTAGYLQIKNDDTGKYHTLWAKGVEGAQQLILGPGET
jgi:hypothetical protein